MSGVPEGVPRHRLRHPQWQLATATLDAVLHRGAVADACLQEAFRTHREMGSRDRALVGALVFEVLRDLRRLQAMAGPVADDASSLCALQALRTGLADVETLLRLGFEGAEPCAQALERFEETQLSAAQRDNLPDAIHAQWHVQYGETETAALAQALRLPAPVDLRVNTLKTDRATAAAALAQSGIEAVDTPWSPTGLRLTRRVALQSVAAFREGWIEPQDEGSQVLSRLLAASPGERIADYCAGAGGKTLAMAATMQDRGELWALDIDSARLARLTPRLQRAGVRCVQRQGLAREGLPSDWTGGFDGILVDAPCSGTGTWRRQPDARLRLPDVAAITAVQREILAKAAQGLRPGGRLVYGTCSLLASENDAIVDDFLQSHPAFEEADAGRALAAQGIDLPGRRLRMLPHRHATDGFFGALLVRRP